MAVVEATKIPNNPSITKMVCNGTVVKENEIPKTEKVKRMSKYTPTLVEVAARTAVTTDGA